MATTQLADLYNPVPFRDGVNQVAAELNAFIASGVLVADSTLSEMASGGGMTGEMPYLDDLDRNDPNLTNDDPADMVTHDKITSDKTRYRLAKMHKSWSIMDFANEVARPGDKLGHIINRVGAYWSAVEQKRLIQSAVGVIADNKANDAGDMGITTGANITEMAIESSAQTMGDHKGSLAVIVVHSAVETQLRGLKVLRDHHDPQTGDLIMTTFNGRRVVVDDAMPVTGGVATSLLFATGAAAFANIPASVPSEMDREPDAGNGGGETRLHTRRNVIMQPYGMDFTSATVAVQTASPAELADATNWDRKYERKAIKLAWLETTI